MGDPAAALIVGSPTDPHASAVAARVAERATVVFLDASTLPESEFVWSDRLIQVADPSGRRRTPTRGWLRRLAPPDWHHGIELGTLNAVEMQARLQFLAGIGDSQSTIEWLTDYWATMRAESKMVQHRLALELGVPSPSTVVTTDRSDLRGLGDVVVMKPLGLGAYTRDGVPHAIHARLVQMDDASLNGLAAAPYIAQQKVEAVRHLRVPTVLDRSWPCELDAAGLPLDWRADDEAHSAWTACSSDEPVGALATRIAAGLGLGYSCQDWIEDVDGVTWLVDVNPGGQWLFLPDEAADAVTQAIADWLAGG